MTRAHKPHACPDCGIRFRKHIGLEDHRRDAHGYVKPQSGPVCIECGGEAKRVTGKVIYPHRPDLYAKSFWLCACGAYCGCHPNSFTPLGHPCGPVTRKARSAAHAAFDPLWKSRQMSRQAAYAWLSQAVGIEPERCHIGMMTAEQAQRVVAAVQARHVEP